jgi:hypothetical protein
MIIFNARGIDIDAQTLGLRVTLIDFSLSRVRMPSGDVAFCDLNSDPLLFEGPAGNIQVI